jgi:hypothetical protein
MPTRGSAPLRGITRFHLHPTFIPSVVPVVAEEGIARLERLAYGAFTVGAEVDDGATQLELDLAEDSNAPQEFREA